MITLYHDIEQNYDSNADPQLCRAMVKEFLKLEKKYNVPVTYNVVGKLFEEQPDLIQSILGEGQEIAFHSYNHQKNWNPDYFSNEIDLCRKVSPIPLGYRSPRSQINQDAVRTIWENGFLWNAEGDYHTEPYFIYKGLVRLPITGDDWSLHQGKINEDKWVQNFSNLLNSRTYIAFGLHDYIASFSPEKILKAWERILQIAVESKNLLLNFSEAADLFRRSAISRYLKFNEEKNRINKIYFTKPFEEIIKSEVEKLDNPFIANLFYFNNNLSFKLTKYAYNLAIDSSIALNDGTEIIDSKAPHLKENLNNADFIICANCTEYQFWPDHFLDKIKKISKLGATCIVTFPQKQKSLFSDVRFIPEIIKHYYTREEVVEWAYKIGSGHIIQIDGPVLTSNNNRIKEENNQAAYWVFIGKVQNMSTTSQIRRIISISEATFNFPNPLFENFRIFGRSVVKQFFGPVKKAGKYFLSSNPFKLSH
jgi:hypothetical protein